MRAGSKKKGWRGALPLQIVVILVGHNRRVTLLNAAEIVDA